MGYRSHPWAPRAVWPAYRGLQRHRLRKAREAAADPAFLNGDRPWVEISSLLNGRLSLSRAAREGVVMQRSMIHRYATKISRLSGQRTAHAAGARPVSTPQTRPPPRAPAAPRRTP